VLAFSDFCEGKATSLVSNLRDVPMCRRRLVVVILVVGNFCFACDLKFQKTQSVIINEPPTQVTRGFTDKSHPAWSPDGSKIAYSVLVTATELSTFSFEGEPVGSLGRVGDVFEDRKSALSPDGQRLVYQSIERQHLWLVDLVTQTETILTPQHPDAQHPAWSDDGQTIAFSAPAEGNTWHVWTTPATGGTATEITATDGRDFHPSWSPDGGQIVFESEVGGLGIIKVIDLDSLATTPLTSDTLDNGAPDWSPDGAEIAFASRQGAESKIFTIPADSGEVKEISVGSILDDNPAWSADGSRIAYYTPNGIWVSSSEGELLNQTSVQDFYPIWIPGQNALIQTEPIRSAMIEVISLLDSVRTAVTDFVDSQEDSEPAWFPDSQTIAFTRRTEEDEALYAIWTVRFPDGEAQPLIRENSTGPIETNPAVSPDGNWMVFDDDQRLFLLPLSGGEPVDLSPFIGTGLREPSWSPLSNGFVCSTSNNLRIFTTDSSLVIAEQTIPGRFDHPTWAVPDPVFGESIAAERSGSIFLISLERSTQDRIIIDGGQPDWAPDGRTLTFVRDDQIFVLLIIFSLN
jgi:Tol biopolymer transport system component